MPLYICSYTGFLSGSIGSSSRETTWYTKTSPLCQRLFWQKVHTLLLTFVQNIWPLYVCSYTEGSFFGSIGSFSRETPLYAKTKSPLSKALLAKGPYPVTECYMSSKHLAFVGVLIHIGFTLWICWLYFKGNSLICQDKVPFVKGSSGKKSISCYWVLLTWVQNIWPLYVCSYT